MPATNKRRTGYNELEQDVVNTITKMTKNLYSFVITLSLSVETEKGLWQALVKVRI